MEAALARLLKTCMLKFQMQNNLLNAIYMSYTHTIQGFLVFIVNNTFMLIFCAAQVQMSNLIFNKSKLYLCK